MFTTNNIRILSFLGWEQYNLSQSIYTFYFSANVTVSLNSLDETVTVVSSANNVTVWLWSSFKGQVVRPMLQLYYFFCVRSFVHNSPSITHSDLVYFAGFPGLKVFAPVVVRFGVLRRVNPSWVLIVGFMARAPRERPVCVPEGRRVEEKASDNIWQWLGAQPGPITTPPTNNAPSIYNLLYRRNNHKTRTNLEGAYRPFTRGIVEAGPSPSLENGFRQLPLPPILA